MRKKVIIQNPPMQADNVISEDVQEAIKKVKTKKYMWSHKAVSSFYYEVETGRIVGQYSSISLGNEIYHAEVNGDSLGEFISERYAMLAVEKQIEKNDRDDLAAQKFTGW